VDPSDRSIGQLSRPFGPWRGFAWGLRDSHAALAGDHSRHCPGAN
jgi:hypothetical protein